MPFGNPGEFPNDAGRIIPIPGALVTPEWTEWNVGRNEAIRVPGSKEDAGDHALVLLEIPASHGDRYVMVAAEGTEVGIFEEDNKSPSEQLLARSIFLTPGARIVIERTLKGAHDLRTIHWTDQRLELWGCPWGDLDECLRTHLLAVYPPR